MDCQAVALRVLAHFGPGPKVLEFLAPEADWLDIRWCGDDDSADSQAAFYRELPAADVIWHVLRPLSGAHLLQATLLRLVHKRYLVEAVANCRRLRDGKLGAPPACGGLAHMVNQPTGY